MFLSPIRMLFMVAVLSALAFVGTSIDYSLCYWAYGGTGQELTCDSGYVSVGSCGSDGTESCNSQSTGIHCCRIKCEYLCYVNPSRCTKASFYIPEHRLNFPTTKGFRTKISMQFV